MISKGYMKGHWELTGIQSDDFLCVVEDDSRSHSEAASLSLTCFA